MRLLLFLIFILSFSACKKVDEVFSKKSVYEKYVESLKKADLLDTELGQKWIEAGRSVFEDSVIVDIPHSETGFFSSDVPAARGYQFEAKAGQVLKLEGNLQTEGKVFIDLFMFEDGNWEHLEGTDSIPISVYEFDEDSQYFLRIQPELLINVYYAITITTDPALENPVANASNRSIGSFYGDPRDRGVRSHEGVDIFASKGTPVIAPADGYISRVGMGNLGGKVIWMRDRKRNLSYYFAHLDSQLVKAGINVRKGDTIGLVGNTGNARTTPPHLHFGIYKRGSKDPISYIKKLDDVEMPEIDTSLAEEKNYVTTVSANLRTGPTSTSKILNKLDKNQFLKITAKSNEWYRVELPDKKEGFIHSKIIKHVDDNMIERKERSTFVFSAPKEDAIPIKHLENELLSFLAKHNDYYYIRSSSATGWVKVE